MNEMQGFHACSGLQSRPAAGASGRCAKPSLNQLGQGWCSESGLSGALDEGQDGDGSPSFTVLAPHFPRATSIAPRSVFNPSAPSVYETSAPIGGAPSRQPTTLGA